LIDHTFWAPNFRYWKLAGCRLEALFQLLKI
jgi:hypothetical protein